MSDFEDENPADWGVPTESHSLTVTWVEGEKPESFAAAPLIRFDGVIHANWRGTANCCDQSRVDAEWFKELDKWTEEQKRAHPELIFVNRGWRQEGLDGECRRWENWPNGRRCQGQLSGHVFANFREP